MIIFFSAPITIRSLQYEGRYKNVVITRGNVLKTLLSHFKDDDVFNCHLYFQFSNNVNLERGIGAGVSREAFTEFFVEFLDGYCVGDHLKVPQPKLGVSKEDWEAISRVFGYATIYNIFPRRLCRTSTKMFMLGVRADDSEIIEDLLSFVSQTDRLVLQNSIDRFNDTPYDELLTVLARLGSSSLPTEQNFRSILIEIGEFEFLQKPFFCISTMREIIKNYIFPISFSLADSLSQEITYGRLAQQMLSIPVNEEERKSWNSLNSFLREASVETLELFLRFSTGTNQIPARLISVDYQQMSEVARRPISHSCSLSLTIPSDLNSEEMGNCLQNYLSKPMEFDME